MKIRFRVEIQGLPCFFFHIWFLYTRKKWEKRAENYLAFNKKGNESFNSFSPVFSFCPDASRPGSRLVSSPRNETEVSCQSDSDRTNSSSIGQEFHLIFASCLPCNSFSLLLMYDTHEAHSFLKYLRRKVLKKHSVRCSGTRLLVWTRLSTSRQEELFLED